MKILMTGITGLVGAGFTVELLRDHPDFRIVSLCRGGRGVTGRERADEAIRHQCAMNGTPEIADEILSRVEIIEGTLANLPMDAMAALGPYDTFFHCAADVNLGKDPEGKVYATNFEGTKKALELAKMVKVKTFHCVSTAYVAGTYSGTVMEDSMPATGFYNPYEKSKFHAEKLVRESGFDFSIYRPSIIVGRRSDGLIRKPLAFYRILEFLGRIKTNHCKKMGLPLNGPLTASLRMEAGTTDRIYFVPQDYVQETIAKLFVKPVCNKTYHITGASPVATKEIQQVIWEVLQTTGLSVEEKVENPTREEAVVQRMIGDLMPYFASHLTFDSSNVIKELGPEVLDWKLGVPFLRKMIRSYYKENFPELLPEEK